MIACADFETNTTPDIDTNSVRVWAYAIFEIGSKNNFLYGNSLDDFMEICSSPSSNDTFYFHNLKFDVEFITYWLFEHGFTHVKDRKKLEAKTFTTLISDMGQYYSIEICFDKGNKRINKVTIYDSMKLFNFSVAKISQAFGLPISKLELEEGYNKYREKGHILTQNEIDYIRNDVEVVAQALDVFFKQGHNKMTIGSNALANYKDVITKKQFEKLFPIPDYDKDIRQCYKGGYVYVQPEFKGKIIGSGFVLDVNSLYPWAMRYCKMPYGEPIFYQGKYKKDKLYDLYIQTFTCQFELKKNHIPSLQLKNNSSFMSTKYVTSSHDNKDNEEQEVTLCLTSVDMKLFFEQYDVYNITYHSGYKFKSILGLFDNYIDSWIEIKNESTLSGNLAMRTIAKLFLNSLYGKFSTSTRIRSKFPTYDGELVHYELTEEEEKKPVYLPVGAFITSYARYKTISSAQKIEDEYYKGNSKIRFVYADTDSLHCLSPDNELPSYLEIDAVKLGAWKHESSFKQAKFLRQKSYMELEEHKGKEEIKITCAGMPSSCYKNVTFENFTETGKFEGKLRFKRVKGGVILEDTLFTIKNEKVC